MGIITEYFELQRKYEAQYGERTVVLMQVGTFYEIWEYSTEYCTSEAAKVDKEGKVWNENIGHAVELSTVLNSVLTHEDNNEPYSISNPHKVGFPVIAYEKNRATLLASNYTIVRIDQVKGQKTKGITERFVAEVCSPTMHIDNITTQRATSNIMCIYIEYQQGVRMENFLITTGAAVIDILTGQNRVCEFYSKADDQVLAVQELYRFLISHYPQELLIHINDMPAGLDTHTETAPNSYIKHLERVLELKRFDRRISHVNDVPPDYKKLAYQIEFLNKLFTKVAKHATKGITLNIIHKRNEHIIEDLGLERMNYARIAYMLLMQHCHSHNPDIIAKLTEPDLEWLDCKRHLILTHNAIVQLDLISQERRTIQSRKKATIDSLLSVLDQTQTYSGRRLLANLLQNPMSDPGEINTYYDLVDEMSTMIGTEPLWLVLDRQLKELPDIERLQRKLEIKLITPKELAVLYHAYIKIINIYSGILQAKTPVLHKYMLTPNEITNFNAFITKYTPMINFKDLEYCYIDTAAESDTKWLEFTDCPIRIGFYPELTQRLQELIQVEAQLELIVGHLNSFLTHTKGKKLEYKTAKKKPGAKKQDPTGTLLITTTAKATHLLTAPVEQGLCGKLEILPYTTSERIVTSTHISEICAHIDALRMWMRQYLYTVYESIIEDMVSAYCFYGPLVHLISQLDVIHSYAKVASMYHYHRPILVTEGETSYLEARDIRHPIIERMIDGAYITNDIHLGHGQAVVQATEQATGHRSNGILLFGVNQTGKSSLAKAVALNIIMAQIGCFVPSHLRYKPYSKIITRLSGADNIFKGQSSFSVEMTELRTIVRQADEFTLVIGDEIARGTESNSGMALAASAILSLVKKRSSFIFATHMHDMLKLTSIRTLPKEMLNICHLAIDYDETSKNLIYNRKLQEGAGESIYGLMVARSLELPADFIDQAYAILQEIIGENKNVVEMKPSRYNAKVYVDVCSMCGKTRTQTELHTHHIIEQNRADAKGIVTKIMYTDTCIPLNMGTLHKNAADNLIVLCKECHTTLHANKKELEAVTTATGRIVRVRPDIATPLLTLVT